MTKYLKYLRYLIRHKWYVFLACWQERLYWQGLIHDWSKFLPSEYFPYANYFYGSKTPLAGNGTAGYSKPTETSDPAFDFAWLLHQKRNPHHWQYWVLPNDSGNTNLLKMPRKYWVEMVCDWKGAGRALGKPDTLAWYRANRDKIQLHPDTRRMVEWKLLYGSL